MNIIFLHKKMKIIIPVLVFFLPFIYFFKQVVPIHGQYVGIGNDFDILYYAYKVYLVDCLSNWHFPLWSPSEAAGFPFYSNPFSAAFYPLNIILVLFYKLANGYTRLDHQVFTVFGVAIFGLGIYFWLKETTLHCRSIFLAACIMCVSFKVSELLRFPNAVHTAAWYPWILFAMTKILLSRSLKASLKYGLLLLFFTICFLTAGYPYYIFYSVFLFVPYFLFLLIPLFRKLLFDADNIQKSSILSLGFSGFIGTIVCLPYIYKMSQLLKSTTDRGGGNFDYSTQHVFNFEDTLGSLFFPPVSQAEGWYYFSLLGMLIIILYVLDTLFDNYLHSSLDKLNKNPTFFIYRNVYLLLFLLFWIVLISYITYGKDSYLFKFLWQYMPSFSSLRVWGRMNIILVPIFSLLLAIAYENFEYKILNTKNFIKWIPNLIFLVCYAIILSIQFFFYKNKVYDNYWNTYFSHVHSKDIYFILAGLVSFVLIVSILFFAKKYIKPTPFTLRIIVISFLCISLMDMSSVGNKMWVIQKYNGSEWLPEIQLLDIPQRQRLDILTANIESFNVPRTEHAIISSSSQFNVGIMPNWYFERYVNFLNDTQNKAEKDKLLGKINGEKIYFSQKNNYAKSKIKEFLNDAAQSKNTKKVLNYNGNKLILEVNMEADGYVNFIDNWDSDWTVKIDGKFSSLEKLFGTFKSVYVKEGKHKLIFSYFPKLNIL